MFKIYKPNQKLIIIDTVIILLNIVIVLLFLPLTTKIPFTKYAFPGLLLLSFWIFLSYFLGKYRKLSPNYFIKTIFNLFYTSIIVFVLLGGFILIQPRSPYSQNVLITVLMGVFISEYLFYFIYFAYAYATNYDIPDIQDQREAIKAKPSEELHPQAVLERSGRILQQTNKATLEFLKENTHLFQTGTYLISNPKLDDIKTITPYQYHTIIQLTKFNNIRGINKILAMLNTKLPDEGKFVFCYKTLSSFKKEIYAKNSHFRGKLIYFFHFLFHQVMPKTFFTKRIYFDLTQGKKRTLSKTEVLGRLVFCGYKIEKQSKVGNLNFVIAVRETQPNQPLNRNYGMFIKLRRVGKDGKLFNVYKFRTMHPYAEFLQDYVYKSSSLADGGKFKRDIRITAWGQVMRKYWLDELPMFLNVLKGNMKLVGVRPISQQYFSLYKNELQVERIKHKPGLLPPFYADMPKTLEDIENSEMKYLVECNQKGTFITDIKYFILILKNIIFKKARSA